MTSYNAQGRLYASQATHAAILKPLAELTSPDTVHKLMLNATPNRSDARKLNIPRPARPGVARRHRAVPIADNGTSVQAHLVPHLVGACALLRFIRVTFSSWQMSVSGHLVHLSSQPLMYSS